MKNKTESLNQLQNINIENDNTTFAQRFQIYRFRYLIIIIAKKYKFSSRRLLKAELLTGDDRNRSGDNTVRALEFHKLSNKIKKEIEKIARMQIQYCSFILEPNPGIPRPLFVCIIFISDNIFSYIYSYFNNKKIY